MTDALPPDLVRRGFASEQDRHRDELRRALLAVTRQLQQVQAAIDAGSVDTHALRQMVIDTAEASRHGTALHTLIGVARFALPRDEE